MAALSTHFDSTRVVIGRLGALQPDAGGDATATALHAVRRRAPELAGDEAAQVPYETAATDTATGDGVETSGTVLATEGTVVVSHGLEAEKVARLVVPQASSLIGCTATAGPTGADFTRSDSATARATCCA